MAIETFVGPSLKEFLAFLDEGPYTYKTAKFYLRNHILTKGITDKFIGVCELPEHIECVDNSITLTLTKGTTNTSYTFHEVLFQNHILEVELL
jgi:hypothetical protein